MYGDGSGNHPSFISSSILDNGIYEVSSTIPLSNSVSGYQVTCISPEASVRAGYINKISSNEFNVYMYSTPNTLTDSSFDYQLSRTSLM